MYTHYVFRLQEEKCSTIFFSLVKALSFKYKPGVLKIGFRFTRWKHGKKCQMAVEACVFLKSTNLKKENKWHALSILVKELQFKLSKLAGTMNIVTNCVNFWGGVGADY